MFGEPLTFSTIGIALDLVASWQLEQVLGADLGDWRECLEEDAYDEDNPDYLAVYYDECIETEQLGTVEQIFRWTSLGTDYWLEIYRHRSNAHRRVRICSSLSPASGLD